MKRCIQVKKKYSLIRKRNVSNGTVVGHFSFINYKYIFFYHDLLYFGSTRKYFMYNFQYLA